MRVLKHLAVMCSVAAVMGIVVAGLAIPFAGMMGLTARNTADTIDKLPAEFETGQLAQTTRIVDANGDVITTLYDQNRVYRPLKQISRKMTTALVSIEDYRFYQHGALDLKGTMRAFITNEANNGTVQGGSSLTQQLVKQTLVYQARGNKKAIADATANTYGRKLRELRYAIALEEKHSKDWILERYLNTAYFGDGAYGVQAAAKHYFNVDADELNWNQSAVLAGMVKNPTGYDPTNYPDATTTRRNVVLDRMAQLNVIPREKVERLKEAKLPLDVQPNRNGCVNSTAPWFCDYVVKYLLDDPSLGSSRGERQRLLDSGGLTIKTTMKPAFQRAATNSVREHVWATDQAIGGIAEVEPRTGNVLALAQSRPMGANRKKGQTYLNYVVPQELGSSAGFQAGSTFKAFTLAAAIEKGIPLTTTMNAPQEITVNQADFANCPGAPAYSNTWTVGNSTSSGTMDVYRGTRESVNTFYVQLEKMTGVCAPYNIAKSMGVDLTNPQVERHPSFTLGVVDVSPLEMAEAYATFGARGLHCDAKPVSEILDANGTVVKKYQPSCQQVMKESTADAVSDVLRGVQEPGGFGYSYGTSLVQSDGTTIPSAAKTGTTQDAKAVWYNGYTPQVGTAAMIAGANQYGQPNKLSSVTVAGSYHDPSGSGFAGPMWAGAMDPIADLLEPKEFTEPDATQVKGVMVDVPWVGGMSVAQAKATLKKAGFFPVEGGSIYSDYSYGSVAGVDPYPQAGSGTAVTIYTSAGPPPPPPKPDPKPKPKPKNGGGGGNRGGGGDDGGGNRGGGGGGDNRGGGNGRGWDRGSWGDRWGG